MPTCDECAGNGGWYTAANGDRYLSDPNYRMQDTWQRCPECKGVGSIKEKVAMLPKEHELWNAFVNHCTSKGVNQRTIDQIGERGGISWNTFLAGADARTAEDKRTPKRFEPAFVTLQKTGLSPSE